MFFKNELLKYAFLLKHPLQKNSKELEKTQNIKVVDNFIKFPMVQSLPNSEL